jgi:Fur family ferric uptake transcriptional regulator
MLATTAHVARDRGRPGIGGRSLARLLLHLQLTATLAIVDTARGYADLMAQLRSRGLRMTPQRRAIVSEVVRAKGHISPTAIARKVQADMPGVNASTVYRTLTLLEDVGVLQHSHVETGAEYHRAEEAHHVHLTCRNCGEDDALSLEEAGKLKGLIRRHHGFVADLTHFAITGLCADCAAA